MEIIRKIVIGDDPKDGMAFLVGGIGGKNHHIANIVRDKMVLNTFHIYVSDGESQKRWKEVSGNYIVEFDLDF